MFLLSHLPITFLNPLFHILYLDCVLQSEHKITLKFLELFPFPMLNLFDVKPWV